jgi:hypothetical protein
VRPGHNALDNTSEETLLLLAQQLTETLDTQLAEPVRRTDRLGQAQGDIAPPQVIEQSGIAREYSFQVLANLTTHDGPFVDKVAAMAGQQS